MSYYFTPTTIFYHSFWNFWVNRIASDNFSKESFQKRNIYIIFLVGKILP